jgi:hypothetical protein
MRAQVCTLIQRESSQAKEKNRSKGINTKRKKGYLLRLNKEERSEPKINDFATYLGVTCRG